MSAIDATINKYNVPFYTSAYMSIIRIKQRLKLNYRTFSKVIIYTAFLCISLLVDVILYQTDYRNKSDV